jgi:hypothetical protein
VQIRRKLFGLVGEEGNAASVLGANFAAGFVAGSLAAGATCPLDVAKTRRQIEVCVLFGTLYTSCSIVFHLLPVSYVGILCILPFLIPVSVFLIPFFLNFRKILRRQ